MYLGIDLGTSAVKAVLLDGDGRIAAQSSASLGVSTPRRLWSEQDPEDWWDATCRVVDDLKSRHGSALAAIGAIGLCGQQHGATLLDARGAVLRPAILWNDGRAGVECAAIEAAVPHSRRITGNLAMPGFTAPKLMWVTHHAGSEVGPALGAARLARLAATGERPEEVCTRPDIERVAEPEDELADRLASRLERWRALYQVLRPEMRRVDAA